MCFAKNMHWQRRASTADMSAGFYCLTKPCCYMLIQLAANAFMVFMRKNRLTVLSLDLLTVLWPAAPYPDSPWVACLIFQALAWVLEP